MNTEIAFTFIEIGINYPGEKSYIYIYIKECVKVLIRSQNSKCIRLRVIIGGLIKGIRFSPEIEMVE